MSVIFHPVLIHIIWGMLISAVVMCLALLVVEFYYFHQYHHHSQLGTQINHKLNIFESIFWIYLAILILVAVTVAILFKIE